jgi:hypothetical protein
MSGGQALNRQGVNCRELRWLSGNMINQNPQNGGSRVFNPCFSVGKCFYIKGAFKNVETIIQE